MCNDQYSESGSPIAPTRCSEYIALKSKIAALDKENIVMRRQMVKLIDERDALRAILAPILDHADSHDYAPPLKFSVAACREIKDQINAPA